MDKKKETPKKEKIATGVVRTNEKTGLSKAFEGFFARDLHEAGEYLLLATAMITGDMNMTERITIIATSHSKAVAMRNACWIFFGTIWRNIRPCLFLTYMTGPALRITIGRVVNTDGAICVVRTL